jgi:hypothetical protein
MEGEKDLAMYENISKAFETDIVNQDIDSEKVILDCHIKAQVTRLPFYIAISRRMLLGPPFIASDMNEHHGLNHTFLPYVRLSVIFVDLQPRNSIPQHDF